MPGQSPAQKILTAGKTKFCTGKKFVPGQSPAQKVLTTVKIFCAGSESGTESSHSRNGPAQNFVCHHARQMTYQGDGTTTAAVICNVLFIMISN